MSDPAPPPDAVPLDTQELPGELYLNVHVRVDLRGGREQVTAHVAVDAQGHPVADPGMAAELLRTVLPALQRHADDAPSARAPLDAEALDALSDDDAARLLDGDATAAEALHLARRYVLDIRPGWPSARIAVTATARNYVYAEAVGVHGIDVQHLENCTASSDRSALAGLALRLLNRRRAQ